MIKLKASAVDVARAQVLGEGGSSKVYVMPFSQCIYVTPCLMSVPPLI
jgi:hypothetical protein